MVLADWNRIPLAPLALVGLRSPRTLWHLGPLCQPSASRPFRPRWPGGAAPPPHPHTHLHILRRLKPRPFTFQQAGHRYLGRPNFNRGLKFESPSAQLRQWSQHRAKMNTPPDPPDPPTAVRCPTYWPHAPESGLRQFWQTHSNYMLPRCNTHFITCDNMTMISVLEEYAISQ